MSEKYTGWTVEREDGSTYQIPPPDPSTPVYKITCIRAPGRLAKCVVNPWGKRVRYRYEEGASWVVFDKAKDRNADRPLFYAETSEECYREIDRLRGIRA